MPRYYQGAELGDLPFSWYDSDGTVIDFSSGYTFSVKVGVPGAAASFTKTTGITGAATAPNVTIGWATTDELNSLSAGDYVVQITATRTSDSKTRVAHAPLSIDPVVT